MGCTSNATTPTTLSEMSVPLSFCERSLTRIAAVCIAALRLKSYHSHLFRFSGTIFIRGGQIIADLVVIGVTWKVTYEARSEGSVSSLMGVMFRNGPFPAPQLGWHRADLNHRHTVLYVSLPHYPNSYPRELVIAFCSSSTFSIPYSHSFR